MGCRNMKTFQVPMNMHEAIPGRLCEMVQGSVGESLQEPHMGAVDNLQLPWSSRHFKCTHMPPLDLHNMTILNLYSWIMFG
mmetsp:Transcript_151068/g.263981  ORF Transcript_151068/g.263981 Transcript_151068/m.263981 type:complete len:81 (+) Transcript_151068:1365-1607(+)